jgi:Zn-dependent protease with chaperone function
MKEAWKTELQAMEAERPSAWARLVRPRVVVLPRCLTGERLGAWTLYHLIFVTQAQAACPPRVRRYVLGHEYGHIVCGHAALQWAWLASALLSLIGMLLPIAILLSLGIQSAVLYSLANAAQGARREMSADAAAADLCGASIALEGALWMADAMGDKAKPERQARLAELEQRARGQAA